MYFKAVINMQTEHNEKVLSIVFYFNYVKWK
jgi:hypothetical protein